jgi:hypothetical protein
MRHGSSWSSLSASSWPPLGPALDIQHGPNAPSFFVPLKTLVKHGSKSIHVHKMSNGTKRAIGALTVTAAGYFSTRMIIFKNKPNENISKYELKKLIPPPSMFARMLHGWTSGAC